MRKISNLACGLVAAGLVLACGSSDVGHPSPEPYRSASGELISDQDHNGGTAGFLFLPPTVLQPVGKLTGAFDPGVDARVRICSGTGLCSAAAAIATFAPGGGTGGGQAARLRVLPALQAYVATWDTTKCVQGPCALKAGSVLRLHVYAETPGQGELELGFVDLRVVTLASIGSVDLASYSPLLKGLPYVIAFRVETHPQPPTVQIVVPADGLATNVQVLAIDVGFSASPDPISGRAGTVGEVDVLVNGVVVGARTNTSHSTSGTISYAVDLSSLADQTLTLEAVAYQADHAAGHGTSAPVHVVLDRTAPVLTLTSPADQYVASPSEPVGATLAFADALSGVSPAGIHLLLDGEDLSSSLQLGAGGDTASYLPPAALPAGAHAYTAWAVDRAGNSGAPAVANLYVPSPDQEAAAVTMGTGVLVNLPGASSGGAPPSPVSVTFSEVLESGFLTASAVAPGTLAPPAGYAFVGVVYDISTTVQYTGTITVCFAYDATSLRPGKPVRLFHLAGGSWIDITTSVDTAAGWVCGQTTSLSDFGVGASLPVLNVLAGHTAGAGSLDGTGPSAMFFQPDGVAVDGAGNVYVSDKWNTEIRKVTPSGVVTTIAGKSFVNGSISSGSVDGLGPAARFRYPQGVAIDGAGNLWVADGELRMIDPDDRVSTVTGYTVGGAEAVTTDPAGNVYVSGGDDGVYVVDPAGAATLLLARDPSPACPTCYSQFWGLAVDAAGNLYVGDVGSSVILKRTPDGAVTVLAGTPGSQGHADGPGPIASFMNPYGVAVDAGGQVYVADFGSDSIRVITPAGDVSTLAGSPGVDGFTDGTGSEARFFYPSAVALDAAGNVYVADQWNDAIRKVTPAGVVTTLAGTGPLTGAQDGLDATFDFGITTANYANLAVAANGDTYVGELGNCDVRKVTPAGEVSTVAGTSGICFPYIAVAPDASLYLSDMNAYVIWKVDPDGTREPFAGMEGQGGTADGVEDARFAGPAGLVVAGDGSLWVLDFYFDGQAENASIRQVTATGAVTTVRQGIGGQARGGLAIDAGGNLYVPGQGDVRKFRPDGSLSVLAGSAGQVGYADGLGPAARFSGILSGITVDPAGNVYVTDHFNHMIRQITPAGQVTTLAGQPSMVGTVPGPLPATLLEPSGIAYDASSGRLLVAVPDAIVSIAF